MTPNFDEAWRDKARPVETFSLDAVFEIACVGGTERLDAVAAAMREPVRTLCDALGQPIPASGALPCATLVGHEAPLVAYYRALIDTLIAQGAASSLGNPFPWFSIKPSIRRGDTGLFTFFYLDSAADTVDLFRTLRDAPSAPPGLLFHDLDQGWAMHIDKADGRVLVAEWDCEDDSPVPDVFTFDTGQLAAQAATALTHLTPIHAALVRAFNRDYWTFRPSAPPTPAAKGFLKFLHAMGLRRRST
ncbi:MAG: hypothetical protein AB1508_09765 [Pseudomonadota bacterium]